MVKQYGQLYLDTRHALLETEDAQTAGMMARHLLCHFSRKSLAATGGLQRIRRIKWC